VGQEKTHLLDAGWIAPDQIRLQGEKGGGCALPAASHLTKTDVSLIGLHLDDSTYETSPVAAVRMAQRRFERDRNGCGPDISYMHGGNFKMNTDLWTDSGFSPRTASW